MSELLRIEAPHFVAGVVVDRAGTVTRAAPIVKYMRGWGTERVERYCAKKGWTVERVRASMSRVRE